MYDCVIPAAGESRRMGVWKPGLPFRDGTILSAVVETVRMAGCRALVVAGNQADLIPGALGLDREPLRAELPPTEVIFNPDWTLGMMGSLQTGMTRVTTSLFFVLLSDMPFVPVSAFSILAREAEARAAAGVKDVPIFPVFHGKPVHPVLIPSSLIPVALALPKDSRFKDFLEGFCPAFVAVGSSGIQKDLDTRADYARAFRPVQ